MFKVLFEFCSITKSWDNINCLDLNIRPDEVVVISSMYRLTNLLDESVVANGPRDRVLNLIKEEALLHYGALFNMLETIVPCKNPEGEVIKRDVFGCEIMNVIACEGTEKIERPERYKEWQKRNTRVGFKLLPQNK
ncbi:hypothetical protein V6N13_028207 [Hibiscus sabdariffa]